MKKELIRPSSTKRRATKRNSTPSYQTSTRQSKEKKDCHSIFKQRFEYIRSVRERRFKIDQPSINNNEQIKQPLINKSKFLQKFQNIRSARDGVDQPDGTVEQQRKKSEFQAYKQKLYLQNRLSNLSIQNSIITSINFGQPESTPLKRGHRNYLHVPTDQMRNRPASAPIEYVQLSKISIDQLLLREDELRQQQDMVGYWKRQNRFVSLIPSQRNEKISFQHPNILSTYAEVFYQDRRYVITDQYKNYSLKHLLEEFGPFNQLLGRRYLKQIALGLQHMHYHRKGHNRLTIKTILYNKNGELFINAVRSTSFSPSRDQLVNKKQFYYFAPQFLLSKGFSKSLKNDVWALGCLAILMLTSTGLTKSPLHPYNFKTFRNGSEQQLIDNLMQVSRVYIGERMQQQRLYKNKNENNNSILSDVGIDFIQKCFKIISEQRPSIELLLQHQFFEGI